MDKKINLDKRRDRVQPIRLNSGFFPLDIHKSMFINDLTITIPTSYVISWGEDIINSHDEKNCKWEVVIEYEGPKELDKIKGNFKAKLWLSFPEGRSKTSNYRIKWNNDFAVQLAKDYPKSFVRALEFHIGDEYYKELKYHEFDIGGFKEQLQVKIKWYNGVPKIIFKEFFRVREQSQGFPKVFNELSTYLIADYLLSDNEEVLRRIQVSDWKLRKDLPKELNENNIYLLLNRDKGEFYIGETKKSISQRYNINQKHHSFDDWTEYLIIQLPPETTNHTRLLIERVLITLGIQLFKNNFSSGDIFIHNLNSLKLMNKRK